MYEGVPQKIFKRSFDMQLNPKSMSFRVLVLVSISMFSSFMSLLGIICHLPYLYLPVSNVLPMQVIYCFNQLRKYPRAFRLASKSAMCSVLKQALQALTLDVFHDQIDL